MKFYQFKSVQVVAACLVAACIFGGCSTHPATPGSSASAPVGNSMRPEASAQVREDPQKQSGQEWQKHMEELLGPEPASWELPRTESGTIGAALGALGVTHCNGFAFSGDFGEQLALSFQRTHLDADQTVFRKALTELLALKMKPGTAIIENGVPRPKLGIFGGMVQTDWGKLFCGVQLDFPQKSADAAGFQIKLIIHHIDMMESEQAAWLREDGSWGWDWESKAQTGSTLFQVEGLEQWYQKYAQQLHQVQKQEGKPMDLVEARQDRFRMQLPKRSEEGKPQTVRDLLVQAGCEAAYPSCLFGWNRVLETIWGDHSDQEANFDQGNSKLSIQWTPWSNLKAQWYQRLLDLPVEPDAQAGSLPVSAQVFTFELGYANQPIPNAAGGRGRDWLTLIHGTQEGTDHVHFVQWQYLNNTDPTFQEVSLNPQGKLERHSLSFSNHGKLAQSLQWSWKVPGFSKWLEEFQKALASSGEECRNPGVR